MRFSTPLLICATILLGSSSNLLAQSRAEVADLIQDFVEAGSSPDDRAKSDLNTKTGAVLGNSSMLNGSNTPQNLMVLEGYTSSETQQSNGLERNRILIVPLSEGWGVLDVRSIWTGAPDVSKPAPSDVVIPINSHDHRSQWRVGKAATFDSFGKAMDGALAISKANQPHRMIQRLGAGNFPFKNPDYQNRSQKDWRLDIHGGSYRDRTHISLVGNESRPANIFEIKGASLDGRYTKSAGSLSEALAVVRFDLIDAGHNRDSLMISMLGLAAGEVPVEKMAVAKGEFSEAVRNFRASLVATRILDLHKRAIWGNQVSLLGNALESRLRALGLIVGSEADRAAKVRALDPGSVDQILHDLMQVSQEIRGAARPEQAIESYSKGYKNTFEGAVANAVRELRTFKAYRALETAVESFAKTGRLPDDLRPMDPKDQVNTINPDTVKRIDSRNLGSTEYIILSRLDTGPDDVKAGLRQSAREGMNLRDVVRGSSSARLVSDMPGKIISYEVPGTFIDGISLADLGRLKLPDGILLNAILDRGGLETGGGMFGLQGAVSEGSSIVGVATETYEEPGKEGTKIVVVEGNLAELNADTVTIDVGGSRETFPRNRLLLYSVMASDSAMDGVRPSDPRMEEAVARADASEAGGRRAAVVAARDGGTLRSDRERLELKDLTPRERMAEVRRVIETRIRDYVRKK